MTEVCETCVWDYTKRLIELERYMPAWNECGTNELLFAIGESNTKENIVHMDLARGRL
jgi:hypothetical protein